VVDPGHEGDAQDAQPGQLFEVVSGEADLIPSKMAHRRNKQDESGAEETKEDEPEGILSSGVSPTDLHQL